MNRSSERARAATPGTAPTPDDAMGGDGTGVDAAPRAFGDGGGVGGPTEDDRTRTDVEAAPGVGRSLFSFRRLRWKLTFSYTLVTVVVLLVFELVLLSFIFSNYLDPETMAPMVAEDLAYHTGPRVQPHLVVDYKDEEALRGTLREELHPYVEEENESAVDKYFMGPLPEASLVALDPERRLLGFSSSGGGFPVGERFEGEDMPGMEPLIEKALDGQDNPRRLYAYTDDGRLLAAAPVKDENGRVLGVVARTSQMPGLASVLFPRVAVDAVITTLLVGLAAMLSGFFTAHRLVRRLRGLTRASKAWSRGDFSAKADDRSRDEIGQLSRDLDGMAVRLEGLVQARQELGELEARNRFARDLHDSVKQQVFAASLKVDTARTMAEPETRIDAHLARAKEMLREAQKELNVLIHEMRPAVLEGKGLAAALQCYTADWSRGSEIPVDLRVRGEREVPLETEQALFRVAQEALANVAKHSGAKRAEVDLAYEPDAITLRVSDDGRGFDRARKNGDGFGLRSMGERLTALGGRVEVGSAPGEGTRVVCVCPLGGDGTDAGSKGGEQAWATR